MNRVFLLLQSKGGLVIAIFNWLVRAFTKD